MILKRENTEKSIMLKIKTNTAIVKEYTTLFSITITLPIHLIPNTEEYSNKMANIMSAAT
ncbi:MAG TPA: hypothetical protein ENG46_01890 [Acidilobales archaeon]|nr:hypothetical protein [Acidilobales archaeon]